MSKDHCCRLDQEFICGIIRNRSGMDSGELDYAIRHERVLPDIDSVIYEVEFLLKKLKNMKSGEDTIIQVLEGAGSGEKRM